MSVLSKKQLEKCSDNANIFTINYRIVDGMKTNMKIIFPDIEDDELIEKCGQLINYSTRAPKDVDFSKNFDRRSESQELSRMDALKSVLVEILNFVKTNEDEKSRKTYLDNKTQEDWNGKSRKEFISLCKSYDEKYKAKTPWLIGIKSKLDPVLSIMVNSIFGTVINGWIKNDLMIPIMNDKTSTGRRDVLKALQTRIGAFIKICGLFNIKGYCKTKYNDELKKQEKALKKQEDRKAKKGKSNEARRRFGLINYAGDSDDGSDYEHDEENLSQCKTFERFSCRL